MFVNFVADMLLQLFYKKLVNMKKLFLSVCLSISTFLAFAQSTVYEKPVVDERMELMGIIFRYVELPHYMNDAMQNYSNEIDKHFSKHKDHPVIKMSEKLVSFGVSFNAIAEFAISLEIKKNKIIFNDNVDINSLDDRWPRDSISKYLVLLNDFYKKTKFHKFFENTSNFRQAAEESFLKEVVSVVDFDWFGKFFRYQPKHKFRIIISLTSTLNYGPSVVYKDGSEEYYSIMACRQEDENGLPMFQANHLTGAEKMLIHELCHSFCDEPINRYLDEFMPQATALYELNREKLLQIHCGSPKSFLGELFVRAAVLQYEKHRGGYTNSIMSIINGGFLGLYQLLDCFDKYSNDTNYKNLTDFMPQIVKHLNSFDFKKIYYEEIPEVKHASIENNSENVDYNLDSITIYFNKEVYPDEYATMNMRSTPALELIQAGIHKNKVTGKEKIIGKDKWSEDGKAWTFYFKNLKPDTEYEISIYSGIFYDKEFKYCLKDSYILTFKTRKRE